MIKRIELTNFMSHEHTVIEPAAGLTVLVGPNNCGKSAVVAALQILCHNDSSTYVLRHGEKECSIKVETADGHTVEWRRKNSPSYSIDGKLFDRLGRNAAPDELQPVLRMPRVDGCEEPDSDVHFGSQKAPIFLLSGTAANRARFFGSSSDVIQLLQMQKRHKDKLLDAQREKNRLEAESRLLVGELSLLEPAVEIDRLLKDLDLHYRNLQHQQTECASLAIAWDSLAAQHEIAAHYTAQVSATAPLSPPPAQLPTDPLLEHIDNLRHYAATVAATSGHVTALTPLEPPPALDDTACLAQFCSEINRLNHEVQASLAEQLALSPLVAPSAQESTSELTITIDQLKFAKVAFQKSTQLHDSLQALQTPPAVLDELPLRRVIDLLVTAARHVQNHQLELAASSSLAVPPAALDTSSIQTLIDQLASAARHSEICATELQQADSDRAQAENLLRTEASETACPVCGGPLDADRLLAGSAFSEGHAHD